jgi:hypothetical protein
LDKASVSGGEAIGIPGEGPPTSSRTLVIVVRQPLPASGDRDA